MKQFFMTLLIICTSFFSMEAQTLRQLVVDVSTGDGVFAESCNSPDQGVLVFKTAMASLRFELNMPNGLINTRYNSTRNEYVLCVVPTPRLYWVTISGPGFEAYDIEVRAIVASEPRFFVVNPKEAPQLVTENDRNAKENFDLGEINFSRNEFEAAEGYFRQAAELQPDNADYLHKLGNVLLVQGSYAQAEDPLARAANLRPNNAEINHLLGNAYFGQSKYTEAANSYKRAVDLEPSRQNYRDDLQKAIVANPQQARMNFDIGTSYLARNNYTEALKYFNEAVRADPQNTTYQTQARRTSILSQQQTHMNAAADAYRSAENNRSASSSDKVKLFREPLNHVSSAKSLGPLTPEWEESARYYEKESKKYKRRNTWLTILLAPVAVVYYAATELGGGGE